jgi:hypothetical protein
MSESSAPPSSEPGSESIPDLTQPNEQPELLSPALQNLFDLERRRLESFNRRTEVARFAVDAGDAADKRQFDYRMARLKVEEEAGKRQDRIVRAALLWTGSVATILLVLLFGMIFIGTSEQRDIAERILITLGIGAGGYGVVGGIISGVRRLLRIG